MDQPVKWQNPDKKTNPDSNQPNPSTSNFGDTLPPSLEADRLRQTTRDGTYLSQLYSQPLVTTLTSFSHVANLVRNPYELINNVDEIVKQASGNRRKQPKTSGNFAKTLNQNRNESPTTSPTIQEMDTFVACPDESLPDLPNHSGDQPNSDATRKTEEQSPIPALPPIECSNKRGRLTPFTIEEYESKFRQNATDVELIERVFYGSIANDQLRAALWPYLFGLIQHRGKFEEIQDSDGRKAYIFVEHEANTARWHELQETYYLYQAQWLAILPDQEKRFSSFRERKSLIERDVIRCDRLHPFYAEQPNNLAALTSLLMTYMMYDFDIGYVQGMSDLAGPILYMYKGDIVKSFWIFVEVMKLFRRNFELTQKTIHFQLNCLYELIRCTDPIFANFLEENESSNCFFAFRAIVCQFKRELMKEDEDDYSKVLFLWDVIWSASRRQTLQEELDSLSKDEMDSKPCETESNTSPSSKGQPAKPITEQPLQTYESPFYTPLDPNQSDSPRYKLSETEIFVLSLCLSMIRRERDIVLANKLDGPDIHRHFVDPKLASDMNSFIEHGINIYSYLKNDFDITLLTSPPKEQIAPQEINTESPQGSAEGYDLLNDYLVIHGGSGA